MADDLFPNQLFLEQRANFEMGVTHKAVAEMLRKLRVKGDQMFASTENGTNGCEVAQSV
jgi:hypothetical protein